MGYFSNPESVYQIRSYKRGLAVIIDYAEFLELEYSPRPGSEIDVMNLTALFQQLGFEVLVHKNLTQKQTLLLMEDLAENQVKEEHYMMILCMASHGEEKHMLATYDCLTIDTEKDVLRKFNNENCPQLRGKPKVFLFQSCQGQEVDYGVEVRGSHAMGPPGSPSKSPSIPLKDPSWEDMLVAYATLPGYVAYRHAVNGTWFIQSFCKVLMERSHDTSLRDMLDMVARTLKSYKTETGKKQSFKYEVIHFYKKLFFQPGLAPPQLT